MDVLGVVTGSIRATTLASGEAADVFDIMDCTASVPAQIMRSDMDAQHSYVDGTVLAIKGAKLAAAAHGRITLVAPEANVKLWPRAQQARELNDWYLLKHQSAGSQTDQFGDDAFDFGAGWAFPSGAAPPSLPPSPPSSAPPSPRRS